MSDFFEWCAARPKLLAWVAVLALLGTVVFINTIWYVNKINDERETYLNVARFAIGKQKQTAETLKQSKEALEEIATLVSDDNQMRAEGLLPLRRDVLLRALRFYRQFIDARKDVKPGEDEEITAELAQAHFRSAMLTTEIGTRADSLTALEKARDFLKGAADPAAEDTTIASQLLAVYNYLGFLQSDSGQVEPALESYQNALVLVQQLVEKHPKRDPFPPALAATYNNLGNFLADASKPTEALASHQKALSLFQALASKAKEPGMYQGDVASTHNHIGSVHLKLNQPDEALKAHRQAQEMYQKLLADKPDRLSYSSDIGSTLQNIGEVLEKTGKKEDAVSAYQSAIDRQKAAFNKEPGSYRRVLNDALLHLARVQRELDRVAEAAATTQMRQEIWAKVKSGPELYHVAADLALLVPKSSGAEQKKYADLAMDVLRQAATNGFADAENLKTNKDLAPLHGRDDFKKLLAELEAKAKEAAKPEAKPPTK